MRNLRHAGRHISCAFHACIHTTMPTMSLARFRCASSLIFEMPKKKSGKGGGRGSAVSNNQPAEPRMEDDDDCVIVENVVQDGPNLRSRKRPAPASETGGSNAGSNRGSTRAARQKHDKRSKKREKAFRDERKRIEKQYSQKMYLMFPRRSFCHFIRDITTGITFPGSSLPGCRSNDPVKRWTPAALYSLQYSTEQYLAQFLGAVHRITVNAKRITVMPRDVQAARDVLRFFDADVEQYVSCKSSATAGVF